MTPSEPTTATLQSITGDENLLILVSAPADETIHCGGLIAAICRRGRPPFIMVLGDGTHQNPGAEPPDQLARKRERETRAAVACLGLPRDRLLMAGLYDGQIPEHGPLFDRVVQAVTLVMWARDCNVILAPWPNGGAATYRIAEAVAAASGVGLRIFVPETAPDLPPTRLRLDISHQLAAKQAALAAHASIKSLTPTTHETFA